MLAASRPKIAHFRPPPPPGTRDTAGMINAIDRVMAVIEFNPDGTIITANANFSSAMGYGLTKSRAAITACSLIRPTPTATTTAASGTA